MAESELKSILALEPGFRRTAALVSWFQGLYSGVDPPILVGGGAVELQTQGAYTTGDLDFVGNLPATITHRLEEAGFQRRGRHWVHDEGGVFIELPALAFDRDVRIDVLEFERWSVLLISAEDLLVDRLASWKFWKVRAEGMNAYLLWRDRHAFMDLERLDEIAGEEHVADALDALRSLAGKPGHEPSMEEVERWAAKG